MAPPGTATPSRPIAINDALRDEPGGHADVVITKPPFGKKSSVTVVNEEGETDRQTLTYNRLDIRTTTSNKQLNFVFPFGTWYLLRRSSYSFWPRAG